MESLLLELGEDETAWEDSLFIEFDGCTITTNPLWMQRNVNLAIDQVAEKQVQEVRRLVLRFADGAALVLPIYNLMGLGRFPALMHFTATFEPQTTSATCCWPCIILRKSTWSSLSHFRSEADVIVHNSNSNEKASGEVCSI
jgi:hypothetical protein